MQASGHANLKLRYGPPGIAGAWNNLGRAGARVVADKTCNVPLFFKRYQRRLPFRFSATTDTTASTSAPAENTTELDIGREGVPETF